MAKNCLLVLSLICSTVSFAQVKLGLIGGPQSANITETNSIRGWDSTTGKYYNSKSGIHAGITAEIPFGSNSHFYFQPSAMYSVKGRNFTKILNTSVADTFYSYNTTRSLTIQYIDIPLNIAVKLPLNHKKTSSFMISAGPYVSLFFNGKEIINQNDQVSSSVATNSTVVNKTNVLDVGKKEDSYRTLGYGINGRAGFEFGNITLTGFYSQGFDNLYYATYPGTFKHKVYGASLGIWLAQTKEPVVIKDKDKDGVPDNKDACPLQAGTAITNGCPDKDGDGVADIKDQCPDVAGLLKYNGCPVPDTDKDGVNDEEDKCPTVAGLPKYGGCPIPDTDKDGVNDEEDKCPTVAGLLKYHGCPIPDTDNDGVNDEADKCPDVAGTADNNGCPVVIKEEVKKRIDYAAENILFLTNSSILSAKSDKPLQTVVNVLKENPALKITINGYTDNTGSEQANRLVSGKRAQAVRAFLVEHGIDISRITINGLGPINPVADNSTAEGRAKNRRVELKLEQ
ncbi:MAG: OmpA family protein [Chitinophagaceae bacterium]